MADRQYDIEILIQARNAASKKLQELQRELGKIDKELDGLHATGEKIQNTLDGVTNRLGRMGRDGKTSAKAAGDAFEEFEKSVDRVDKKISETTKNLDKAFESLGLDNANKKTQDLIKSLDILAKKSARSTNLLDVFFNDRELQDKLGKLPKQFRDVAKTYYDARVEAERNASRAIIAERAKVEAETTRLIKNAEANRAYAVEESLAKIAESRQKLRSLGEDVAFTGIFGRALGGANSNVFGKLVKDIQSIGLATEKERLEIERFANNERIIHLQRLRDQAIEESNTQKLKKIVAELAAEKVRAEEEAKKLHDREIETQKKLLEQSIKTNRGRIENDLDYLRKAGAAHDEYIRKLDEEIRKTDEAKKSSRDFEGVLGRLQAQSRKTDRSLSALAISLQGFQVAFAIKYAQALLTSVVALGGELVALGGYAISAGFALGGALAAGAAQAIGPMAILAGLVGRITAVGKILNLQQQIREASIHTKGGQARKDTTDTNSLANATDSLRNAQERLTDAQNGLTQAREDARRKLEDLIDAEQRARLASLSSQFAFEDAQRRARLASTDGGAAALAEADLGVDRAALDLRGSRRDEARAITDARRARRRGVEGSPEVVRAKREIADANRAIASSERQLAAAQEKSADSTYKNTAAQDRLRYMLSQLSPAERELVKDLGEVQKAYRAAFRPTTDIVVEALSRGVKRAIPVLKDPNLLASFDNVATQIGKSIDKVSAHLTKRTGFAEFFNLRASRNIGPLTDALIKFSDAFLNIAKAATPLFDYLVDVVDEFATKFSLFTGDSQRMKEFFSEGKSDLETFFELIKAIGRVFAAIFDPARDAGRSAIQDLTGRLNKFADFLKSNRTEVRKFFSDAHSVFNELLGVVIRLAVEIARSFDAGSVKAFADFLNAVVIPAIGGALRTMGLLAQTFHQVFGAPVISDITKVIATLLFMQRGLEVISLALQKMSRLASIFFVQLTGLGATGKMATFIQMRTAFVGIATAMALFGDSLKSALTSGGLAAALAGLIMLAGGALKVAKAMKEAEKFTKALKIAMATTPWGAALLAIGLVATALGLFTGENKKAAKSAEEVKDKLNEQLDALRAIRDFEIESKDRKLGLQRAELNLAHARERYNDTIKQGRQEGESELRYQRRVKDAQLDVKTAELELARARNLVKDTSRDKNKIDDEGIKKSKEDLGIARERRDSLKDDVKGLRAKITSLKEHNGEVLNLGKAGTRIINNDKEIRETQEKLRQKTDDLREADRLYRRGLRQTGDTWSRVGGNAISFGLTLDEVFKYLQDMANGGLSAFGAKTVKFYRSFSGKGATLNKSISELGDELGTLTPTPQGKAQGGLIDGYGLYDTVPIMAAPGEGILNRHQMPVVDAALRLSGLMGGGLNQLWSTITTPHYMASGGPVRSLLGAKPHLMRYALLARKYGLKVTSGLRAGDTDSYHGSGDALDLSDGYATRGELQFAQVMARRFGRGLEELIHTPLGFGIKNGKRVAPYAQADHFDHVHVADVDPSGAGGLDGLFSIPPFSVKTAGGGYLARLGTAMARRMRRAAIKFVNNKALDSIEVGGKTTEGGLRPSALRSVIGRAMDVVGIDQNRSAWASMLYRRALQESGGNPNVVNNWDINAKRGDPSRGLFQTIGSTFNAYKLRGHNNIFSPLDNAIAAIRYMIAAYGKGNQTRALANMVGRAGRGYASGGAIGNVNFRTPAVVSDFAQIARDIASISKGTGKKNLERFMTALRDLTADNGPMSRFSAQIEDFKARMGAQIQRDQFKISKNGVVRKSTSDREDASNQAFATARLRDALLEQRGEAVDALDANNRAVKDLEKDLRNAKGNKKKETEIKKRLAQAKAGRNAARNNVDSINQQLAQNLQDIFEARKAVEQAIIDQVTSRSDRRSAGTSIRQRIASALGNANTVSFDQEAIDNLKKTQTELRQQLINIKNPELRQQVLDKIAELEADIAEATAKKIDDQIQAIDDSAAANDRSVARKQRAADLVQNASVIGFRAANALRGAALVQQGSGIRDQIGGITAILGQLDPNSDKAKELREKLEDLNLQLAENEQAIKSNTVQLQQAELDRTTGDSSFINGILSSGVNIVQALGNLSGNTNNPLISMLLSLAGSNLQTTGNSLATQLDAFFKSIGWNNVPSFVGNSPEQIVSRLSNLSNVDLSFLTPDQQSLFRSLVNSVLENTQAQIANTQQIKDLTSNELQDFSSTSWQWFRQAVFNGANGLLPQYGALVPQMATGGMITREGLFYGHAGEKITPAQVVRGQAGYGGGNINVEINGSNEPVDPIYIAKRIAFEAKSL